MDKCIQPPGVLIAKIAQRPRSLVVTFASHPFRTLAAWVCFDPKRIASDRYWFTQC
jgi:hypothetical protein